MKIKKMNKINCFLLIILIWMQYSLWLGKNGVLDFIHIYNSEELHKNINSIVQMKLQNYQLLSEIHNLVYRYELVEEYARYDLGMIKSNEFFYRIKLE